jgi:hypothetical protein
MTHTIKICPASRGTKGLLRANQSAQSVLSVLR